MDPADGQSDFAPWSVEQELRPAKHGGAGCFPSTIETQCGACRAGQAAMVMGPGEWLSGYSVLGVSFDSGHVLALRRFTASSIGPGYASVWHRTPAGVWTFYATVRPEQACARYFGAAVDYNVLANVEVEWAAPNELRVSMADTLDWRIRLTSSVATRLFNRIVAVWPEGVRPSSTTIRWMEWVAKATLGTGRMALTGHTPNRNPYALIPRRVWLVASSRAAWRGHDLGPCGALTAPASLAGVRIPERGLFIVGQEWFGQPTPRGGQAVAFGRPCSPEATEGCRGGGSTDGPPRGGNEIPSKESP